MTDGFQRIMPLIARLFIFRNVSVRQVCRHYHRLTLLCTEVLRFPPWRNAWLAIFARVSARMGH